MFLTNETASQKIFVDDIALFGIKNASKDDGLGISLDISDALQQLLPNAQNENNMKFRMLLKPRDQLPGNTKLTIGQISIYHEQN